MASIFVFSLKISFFKFKPKTSSKFKIVSFLSLSGKSDFKISQTKASASGIEKSSSIFSINLSFHSSEISPPSEKFFNFETNFSLAVCEASKDSQVKFCLER
ncbi:MAG TPA: hypothetical protein EYG89_04300 [Bacteroidia bacterium]|nr:hypothetical protein [Bacteroidia bacterium]